MSHLTFVKGKYPTHVTRFYPLKLFWVRWYKVLDTARGGGSFERATACGSALRKFTDAATGETSTRAGLQVYQIEGGELAETWLVFQVTSLGMPSG
jgi:hypothetical protein